MTKKTNYKNYQSAGEFYRACRKNGKRMTLSMMWEITKVQEFKKITFQEAYEYLLKKGKIIEIK